METTPEKIDAMRDFQKLVNALCRHDAEFRAIIAGALRGEDDTAAVPAPTAEDRPPLHMVDFGDEALSGDDLLDLVETIEIERRVVVRGKAVTMQDFRNLRALLTSHYYDVLIEPGFALDAMVYIAVQPSNSTVEESRAFFDQIWHDIRQDGSLSFEMSLVEAAIRNDEGYRLSWVANLAQAFVMAGVEHYTAQQGAANFLEILARANARDDKHFQHPPETEKVVWADTPPAEEVPDVEATAFGHSTVGCARGAHLGTFALGAADLSKPTRRMLTIELDKHDPAPAQTIAFLLNQLTGKETVKPRLRWRDGLLVYVVEDENAEVALVEFSSK